ncbi:hypothetical protein ISN44_As10g001970 [Arabidopsis suecica]|uniref:Uncharacterized protein n=1 Tax=Arabidopsis suecica TaxID=45249 RepID=A0A8T1ZV02_ARASU|nr:hypothetical protein ISN44_As10g001970 [Arabidopsis suecica]
MDPGVVRSRRLISPFYPAVRCIRLCSRLFHCRFCCFLRIDLENSLISVSSSSSSREFPWPILDPSHHHPQSGKCFGVRLGDNFSFIHKKQ